MNRPIIILDRTDYINEELTAILRDFVIFFELINVEYWLFGGLLECLVKRDYKTIDEKWRTHDIDFFAWAYDAREKILKNSSFLAAKGYSYVPIVEEYRKVVFKNLSGQKIEIPLLFHSEFDNRLVCFLGHGKKTAPNMRDADIRKRIYHHDFPIEYLTNLFHLRIGDLNIRIPNPALIDFVYCFEADGEGRNK